MLHAVLNDNPEARAKPGLQPVIAEHDEWLRGKRFLMVPYHLVGATDLDAAILGGYVAHVRRVEPEASIPPVYRSDAMLDDARRQREFLADDEAFARWLGTDGPGARPGRPRRHRRCRGGLEHAGAGRGVRRAARIRRRAARWSRRCCPAR